MTDNEKFLAAITSKPDKAFNALAFFKDASFFKFAADVLVVAKTEKPKLSNKLTPKCLEVTNPQGNNGLFKSEKKT